MTCAGRVPSVLIPANRPGSSPGRKLNDASLAARPPPASRRAPPRAQSYPARPITMIVPFAAGGPTDIVARIVCEHMSRTLGQQVIVENVAGAGGTTGITRAAQAAPDGYTIMMGHMGTHGAAPALYPEPEIRSRQELRPDRPRGRNADRDRGQEGFPGADLKGFVAHAQGERREAERGPCGRRLGVALDLHAARSPSSAKLTRVAYRGTGPALNDLVAGQVDFMTDQIVNVVPQIQAAPSRRTPSRRPSARRRCRTCRPPRKPGCRTTRSAPGTRSSRRRACRPMSQEARRRARQGARRRDDKKRLLDLGGVDPGQAGPDARGAAEARRERGRALDAGPQGGRRRRQLTNGGDPDPERSGVAFPAPGGPGAEGQFQPAVARSRRPGTR